MVTLVSNIREQAESDTHLSRVVPSPPPLQCVMGSSQFCLCLLGERQAHATRGRGRARESEGEANMPPTRPPASQSVSHGAPPTD